MRVTLLRRLRAWIPPVVLMAAIFVLSAQPDLNSGLGAIDLVGRKLVHFAEYALLAFSVVEGLGGAHGVRLGRARRLADRLGLRGE